MNIYRFVIAYDGSSYFGWQKTSSGPSIQEEMEKSLGAIFAEPIQCEAASRTDRGVHAKGQVVQCVAPRWIAPEKLLLALNTHLPPTIRIQKAFCVDPSSHPTLDAVAKTYRYYFCLGLVQHPFYRRFSWHYPYPIQFPLMKQAAKSLIGMHDFSSFTTEKKESNARTLWEISWEFLEDERLSLRMKGDNFLYKMARTIAGTLANIGSGKLDPEIIPKLLNSPDRRLAGMTAPAHGLVLETVHYI